MNASDLHTNGAWLVVGLNTVVGIWALAAHRRPSLATREMWWATAIAQVAVLIQVTIGVIALQADGVEATQFHMFYGFIAIASVGIIYSYRQQLEDQQYLLYGFGSLFIAGLGLRAIFLAG